MPHFTFDISTVLGLGQDAAALTFTQISLRGIVAFLATLVIVRCGDRRGLRAERADQRDSARVVLSPHLSRTTVSPVRHLLPNL